MEKLSHLDTENEVTEIVKRLSSFNRALHILENNPDSRKKFNFDDAAHNLDNIQLLSERVLKNHELELITEKINGYRAKLEKLAGRKLMPDLTR